MELPFRIHGKKSVLPTGVSLPTRAHLTVWTHCLVIVIREKITTGTQQAEVRHAAKHPPVHRIASIKNNYLAQNASRAEAEKPGLN